MAAEVIQSAGLSVEVFDAKPSACRKFLLAGVGGMNITHAEPYDDFLTRYYDKSAWLEPSIKAFTPTNLRQWIHELGIETFVGTSGRVFPEQMKAAPLLRNWLKRLKESGVTFHMRHRLVGLEERTATFEHLGETTVVQADAIVFALGGASWPKLGSDGKWVPILEQNKVDVAPLESTNCGFYSNWSDHLKQQCAGAPLKGVEFSFTLPDGESVSRKGECIVTADGMEGSLIYAYSKYLRDEINSSDKATLQINLIPDLSRDQLIQKLAKTKAKESFSKYLKRTLKLDAAKIALLYEHYSKHEFDTPEKLAHCLQNIPVCFYKVKPIEEVISSAGGVLESSVDDFFMLNRLPGVFCAGEMLDWEAPTGGYLLTACFATGHRVGHGVVNWLKKQSL